MNLYRFYFVDIEKPIMIEATERRAARIKLQEIIPSLESKGYFLDDLCRESVEELIDGVSEKLIQGKKHVWKENKWLLANP